MRRGDLSYPARAIRTADHFYIRNYRPDRWPAGDPELYVAVGPFGDIDDGPTKQLLLNKRDDAAIKRYFDLSTAKRPAEELFDLKKDPQQLTNVASDPAYAAIRDRLKKELDAWQRKTGDPRATADDEIDGIAIRLWGSRTEVTPEMSALPFAWFDVDPRASHSTGDKGGR